MSDLKRSLTELTINSNIVSLEDIKPQDQKIFNKTVKKGKLFKGPVHTAYNKESLGSIPKRVEKSIVEDKKSISKIGFSTQSERFFPKNLADNNNPGPGSYNLASDEFSRTSTSFCSSKKSDNGFMSGTQRFDDINLFYCKYTPGPCEYDFSKGQTIENNIKKSIYYKSLYNNKKTQSLKVKRNTPGPGQYTPLKNCFEINKEINKKKGNDPFFRSQVERFKMKNKYTTNLIYPGPGEYFHDSFLINYNDKLGRETSSYFFKTKPVKQIDPGKMANNYVENLRKIAEKKQKNLDKKSFFNYKNYYNKEQDILDAMRSNLQGVFQVRIKNLEQHKVFNPNAFSSSDIKNIRNKDKKKNLNYTGYIVGGTGFDTDKGIEYIHKVLEKTTKADPFTLAPDRWKINQLEFKVPGPAYYHPRLPYKTLSFNRNKKDFIGTTGVCLESYDSIDNKY